MKKIASNELKEFLQDWLNWAEGRESKVEYNPRLGLCAESQYWCDGFVLRAELVYLFDKLDYPFGETEWDKCNDSYTQHQDPNRLAWVKAALNDTLDTWELME